MLTCYRWGFSTSPVSCTFLWYQTGKAVMEISRIMKNEEKSTSPQVLTLAQMWFLTFFCFLNKRGNAEAKNKFLRICSTFTPYIFNVVCCKNVIFFPANTNLPYRRFHGDGQCFFFVFFARLLQRRYGAVPSSCLPCGKV